MTKITIKTAAIRGVIQLHANEADPTQFMAVGSSYKPMEFEAATLGNAVDVFMQNIHRLQKSDEAKAKSIARTIKTQATREANQHRQSRLRQRGNQKEQTPVDTLAVG